MTRTAFLNIEADAGMLWEDLMEHRIVWNCIKVKHYKYLRISPVVYDGFLSVMIKILWYEPNNQTDNG